MTSVFTLTGGDDMRLVVVEWEDIVGVSREPLPKCDSDLKRHELIMQTVGYLTEFAQHYVVVTDYDVTHAGNGYCHNDFTIIPKGTVRTIVDLYMSEEIGNRPLHSDDIREGT